MMRNVVGLLLIPLMACAMPATEPEAAPQQMAATAVPGESEESVPMDPQGLAAVDVCQGADQDACLSNLVREAVEAMEIGLPASHPAKGAERLLVTEKSGLDMSLCTDAARGGDFSQIAKLFDCKRDTDFRLLTLFALHGGVGAPNPESPGVRGEVPAQCVELARPVKEGPSLGRRVQAPRALAQCLEATLGEAVRDLGKGAALSPETRVTLYNDAHTRLCQALSRKTNPENLAVYRCRVDAAFSQFARQSWRHTP